MVVGKTGATQGVCLNKQLILLLKAFKWKGFSTKTAEAFSRMRQWLGFPGYSLKRTMMNVASSSVPNLQISQRLAGMLQWRILKYIPKK